MTAVTLIQLVLVVLGWLVSLILTLLHGFLLDWRDSELGVHFFMMPLSMTLVLTPILIRMTIGDFPGRQVITLVMFALVVGVLAHRLFLLVKYYRADSREAERGSSE